MIVIPKTVILLLVLNVNFIKLASGIGPVDNLAIIPHSHVIPEVKNLTTQAATRNESTHNKTELNPTTESTTAIIVELTTTPATNESIVKEEKVPKLIPPAGVEPDIHFINKDEIDV